MSELCVFIPTRKRRELAEKCIASFRETALGEVDLVLVIDDDDVSYAGIGADVMTVERDSLVTAINDAALKLAPRYRALMLAADDQVFVTPGWDLLMMGTLDALGGTGIVYPDDKRRYDVPEHVLMSSDVITVLGWFAEPGFRHFYIDNVWAELGKRSGLMRFCPRAVIRHEHYSVTPGAVRDETYSRAEQADGDPDFAEFTRWRAQRMSGQVSLLRRMFSPDLQWLFTKF
jgi:hypothetical protein